MTKNVRLSGLDGEGKLIGILEIYIETLLYLQERYEGRIVVLSHNVLSQ